MTSDPGPVGDRALVRLAADAVRVLSMDGVQQADSGHPGMPMGMADAAVVLWSRFLTFDPSDPKWPDRDRFVLSAGHGSMLLYSLLHLAGYDLGMDELKAFRQWGSRTPGHPENQLTPGVETTTGPLGQGISNAIGFALAERHLAARFNRPGFEIVDHATYVIASDGDLMEGISSEACSLAGHWRLGRLIVLYDDNGISIDGSTGMAFTEDVGQRFEAYRWQVLKVDGHDPEAVAAALAEARAETDRPSLIRCLTKIGFGSPNKQGTSGVHGSPLGPAEIELTRQALGWTLPPFEVPDSVYAFFRSAASHGSRRRKEWMNRFEGYAKQHPDLAEAFRREQSGLLPDGWEQVQPDVPADKPLATRAASGKTLDVLKPLIPNLIGGSADLTPSNNTRAKGDEDLQHDRYDGRYIRFGVREHAMAAILNGLTLHGGLRAYGGTFLVFSDYMKNAIRLAALMHAPTIFVFTHDSIGLGEDGPTHQPVEQLAGLRAIPGLVVLRPADALETAASWKIALRRTDGPTALILTRQGVPPVCKDATSADEDAARGAYVLLDGADPKVILIGTGSEVQIALEAAEDLAKKGVGARVVSMPSWELFDAQPDEYKESVLPSATRARVAVEALSPLGWERYVGLDGVVIGLDGFGASAPYQVLFDRLGITAEAVAEAAMRVLDRPGV